ncbi:MAG TPA: hypothetical protein IAB61_06990 [Candidatus Merdisoma merdipullorum]|nr:hypothetical protein [Candidatus Merdisoma merdipullorum]
MRKDVWDDIGRAVTGAADTVGRKAGEIASMARLKNQIYSLERDIKRNYEALGKLVYEQYMETGATEKQFESLCEEIAQKEILIDQYEGEIDEKKKEV